MASNSVNVQDAAAGALAPILQSQQQQQAVITTPATPAGQPGHGEDRSVNYKVCQCVHINSLGGARIRTGSSPHVIV